MPELVSHDLSQKEKERTVDEVSTLRTVFKALPQVVGISLFLEL